MNKVTAYRVDDFKNIRTDRYIESDIFYNDKEVGILIDGKIKPLSSSQTSMKNYVKKSEVKKMIEDVLKGDEK